MKTFISLSTKAQYVVEKKEGAIFLSFAPLEGKLVKNDYVKIDLHQVWNKGTKYEQVVPTLEYLNVVSKQRFKGLGEKLFLATLDYMKRSKIPYLIFDDYSGGFWKRMQEKHPDSVFFPKRHKGRIGYIGTNTEFPL